MKLQEQIKKLPDAPGVYFFLAKTPRKRRDVLGFGRTRDILYIGKATSLKERVKSYFSKNIAETRGPLILEMLEKATSIAFEKTDSVLEALLLETRLIKKYTPRYNTTSKDDKSYNHIVITKEEFSRVLLVREKTLTQDFPPEKLLYDIGPFPHGLKLKEALKIIRKIFPYRDRCIPNNKRGCFNSEIGLCPGVCSGKISAKEYQKEIKKLILFFEGKKKALISSFEKEMKKAAKEKRFEDAGDLKRKLFTLQHIQDVSLLQREKTTHDSSAFRIEAYDVAHLSGKEMVGVMTVVQNAISNKDEYRKFIVRSVSKSNDPGALKEILERRFNHLEWEFPNLLVVDGNEVQKRVAEEILEKRKLHIPVVAVVKDKKHKPRAILGSAKIAREHHNAILLANAEAHRFSITFHRQKRLEKFLR